MALPEEHTSADSRPTLRFYYDGDCGLCRWAVKWLSRIDIRRRVAWIPFQSLEQPPHNLSWLDLDRAAYLDCGNGELQEGFYAFRKLTLKLPSLWPLVPVCWLPGVQFPGRAVYRWVAVNRYRLSRCGVPDRKEWPVTKSPATPRDDR